MCGVAGLYSNSDFAKNKVDRMLKVQWHRGPDGSNSFQQDDFYAGMVRLAINDVENGQQPFWCSERRYISFYNGEIYNSPSLRKELAGDGIPFFTLSDGEVILTSTKSLVIHLSNTSTACSLSSCSIRGPRI